MRTFLAFGREFNYDDKMYGERIIECPMGAMVLKTWEDHSNVIEVGNVMVYSEYLLDRPVSHFVADLFENHPKSQRVDGGSLDYHGKDVLSISTLEHFDTADYGNTAVGGTKGPECFEKIIEQARQYFITLPVNWNQDMTEHLKRCSHPMVMFKQVAHHVWEQLPSHDWTIKYGNPFEYANAIVVATNCPWAQTQ